MTRGSRRGRRRTTGRALVTRLERIERQLAARDTAKPRGLRDRIGQFDRYWLTRFMFGLGAWLFVVTIFTFVIEFQSFRAASDDRAQEQEARRLARVSLAWDSLLRPAAGNTGKGDALNLLLAEGADLTAVDLSCEGIGVWRDGACARPAILAGVDLRRAGATAGDAPLRNARFHESVVTGLRADRLALNGAFRDARGSGWQVTALYGFGVAGGRSFGALGDFSCYQCSIGTGEMGWSDFIRFPGSVVRGATVILAPEEPAAWPEGPAFGVQTVLDNPVRILRAPVFERAPDLVIPQFRTEAEAFEAIEWDAYRGLEYCAGPAHYAALDLVRTLPEERRPAIFGEEAALRDGMWHPRGTVLSEADAAYRCGLDFDDVELILRRVLADWSLAHDGGMFRISSRRD